MRDLLKLTIRHPEDGLPRPAIEYEAVYEDADALAVCAHLRQLAHAIEGSLTAGYLTRPGRFPAVP